MAGVQRAYSLAEKMNNSTTHKINMYNTDQQVVYVPLYLSILTSLALGLSQAGLVEQKAPVEVPAHN